MKKNITEIYTEKEKIVVAITSPNHGAGKTTLAKFIYQICTERGIACAMLSFAEPLRIAARTFLDTDIYNDIEFARQKDQPLDIIGGKTPRDFMVALSRTLKMFSPTYFADYLAEKVKSTPAEVIVIDDMRFWPEVEALDTLGRENHVQRLAFVSVEGRGTPDVPDVFQRPIFPLQKEKAQQMMLSSVSNSGTKGNLYDAAERIIDFYRDYLH
ncbi:P-loop NTPase family protein [Pyramidobacter piscolens]|uniref:hypothetical protein n=1 Tax=Pyramidobacter piscolens TaxID=638849 RepID=UPI002AB2DE4C|nr:hypothetical protein [Pyramidobacter piscolens]